MTREMALLLGRDIVLMFPLMRDQARMLKHWQLTTVAQDESMSSTQLGDGDRGRHSEPADHAPDHRVLGTTRDRCSQRDLQCLGEEKREQGDLAETLIPELTYVFNLKSNADKLSALREIDIDLDNIKRESLKEVSKNERTSPRGNGSWPNCWPSSPMSRR